MATFGRTDNTSASEQGTDSIVATKFTVAEAGTITKITAYVYATNGTPISMAIYADNGSGNPGTKLAEDSGSATADGTTQWYECNVSYAFVAGTYHLAVWAGNAVTMSAFWLAGSTNQAAFKSGETFRTWPSPYGTPAAQLDREFCIYATYTPAATGQFARPASDVADGNWTKYLSGVQGNNTDLFSYIDEATTPDDTDSIRSGTSPDNDTCEIALSEVESPAAGTVTMRIRARWM